MVRPLHAAIIIKPMVANPTMTANPSARPQRSSSFASGMYNAAVILLETMYMTVRSECVSNALVANGTRLYKIDD